MYLCLQVHIDNMSQSDITVADLMNVLVGWCWRERAAGGNVPLLYQQLWRICRQRPNARDWAARIRGRVLLFMVPEEATDDSTTLDVTFRTENGEAYQYALQAGESGLLMDRYTQN